MTVSKTNPEAQGSTYLVQKGDTLSKIAKAYQTSVGKILRDPENSYLSNAKDHRRDSYGNKIYPNDKIHLANRQDHPSASIARAEAFIKGGSPQEKITIIPGEPIFEEVGPLEVASFYALEDGLIDGTIDPEIEVRVDYQGEEYRGPATTIRNMIEIKISTPEYSSVSDVLKDLAQGVLGLHQNVALRGPDGITVKTSSAHKLAMEYETLSNPDTKQLLKADYWLKAMVFFSVRDGLDGQLLASMAQDEGLFYASGISVKQPVPKAPAPKRPPSRSTRLAEASPKPRPKARPKTKRPAQPKKLELNLDGVFNDSKDGKIIF